MVSFPFIMNIALVAEELVWWVRVLTAFGEDPSLVHSPCMKQLTAACNCRAMMSGALFWPPCAPTLTGKYLRMDAYVYIIGNRNITLYGFNI